MLHYNNDLWKTNMLKKLFYDICQNQKYSLQRTQFYEWKRNSENSAIPEFEKCTATYKRCKKNPVCI